MKQPFSWDNYSDQAALLRDKAYKKKMRKKEWFSLTKTAFLSLFLLPIGWLLMPFARKKPSLKKTFFTLGVDFERETKETLSMLKDLGVESILVRIGYGSFINFPYCKSF